MSPYLVNPHRDDEFLIPKRDLKGNVVHYRRRRYRRSEEDDARLFLATGAALTAMFAWMIVTWINAPL